MTTATITTLTDRITQPAGLVWENPPAKVAEGKYASVAAALKARPGQWAVLRTYEGANSHRGWKFAAAIRSGKLVDFREGFEATSRTIDNQVRVYVRYQPLQAV